jgi:hypothetical protein
MKNNERYIIGIDPDLHKSGIAIYDRSEIKLIMCMTFSIWQLFDFLMDFENENKDNILIRLEYSNSTNTWHLGGRGSSLNVGKNQAVAIIIKEFLEFHQILYELIPPSGYSRFFNDKNLFKKTTKWIKSTNKDARAAAAMIWNY